MYLMEKVRASMTENGELCTYADQQTDSFDNRMSGIEKRLRVPLKGYV